MRNDDKYIFAMIVIAFILLVITITFSIIELF